MSIMFQSPNSRSAGAYQRINVETSMYAMDQHQIVSLLFDGLLNALSTARGALARGDIPAKCEAISKSLRIIEEGLTTGLDKVDGGEIAQNLAAVYDYSSRRLILANARNDDEMLQQVQRLIEPIAQGWKSIKNPATAGSAEATRPVSSATV
jgi:flagellar protein FliS